MNKRPAIERFWNKVDEDGPVPDYAPDLGRCWIWLGGTADGYGLMGIEGKSTLVHRYSFTVHRGEIPAGLHLDHLCRVRNCVNPWHLEAVTPRTNILRGAGMAARHAVATQCKNGHPFNEENTAIRLTGGRKCRACARRVSRERWARKRASHITCYTSYKWMAREGQRRMASRSQSARTIGVT